LLFDQDEAEADGGGLRDAEAILHVVDEGEQAPAERGIGIEGNQYNVEEG
jgi:hypothetical protein